jgi:aryl-alcohol dehydrogenase-like predicted oxidoreductase
MEYRQLGRTGIRISRLCFGTMSFGGAADQATSEAMYRRCRDAGINVFDCANVYSAGRAEEILGRLIGGERDRLVILSKVGFAMGEGPNEQGLSRRHILASVDASLERLDTDWLDLLFFHRFDASTPIEESLHAVDQLVRDGTILAIGVSNWAAWQVAKGLGLSALHDLPTISCIQPMYNLVKRQAEVELLPLAQADALGVITYSPLGGGLLTGKYGVGRRPDTGRLVENEMYRTRYGDEGYFETAERFAAFARERDVHPATLAVAWVAHHPAVTAPIIGARNVEQLEPSLAAADFEMDEETYAAIAALAPTPPPATDRTEEQAGLAYKGSAETYK